MANPFDCFSDEDWDEHMFEVLALCNQLVKGVIERQRLDEILLVGQVELAEEILPPVGFKDFSQTRKVVELYQEL